VPEAITFGTTEEEALETALLFYVNAKNHPDLPTVRPSALEGIKLAVYREMTIQLYKA
jgi:hypothetical protein